MKHKKITLSESFKELGEIDKCVEKGKYTKTQHNKKTKIVLRKLIKGNK